MKLKLPVSIPPRRFDPDIPEMMDLPDLDPILLKDDLGHLRQINRMMGAHRILTRTLDSWLFTPQRTYTPADPLRILDLCTGSGDLPRTAARWLREQQIPFQILATDRAPETLACARELSFHDPEISFQQVDLLKPDLPDQSYDLVMCHLALHHFTAEDAVRALQNMFRLTRHHMLVQDLKRSPWQTRIARALIPLMTTNPMTRFDAMISTERAFTPFELRRLAHHAGIPSPVIQTHFPFRQTLRADR